MTVEYKVGDCLEVPKPYPDDHFDSCVTDPPYGLAFMGKTWDMAEVGPFTELWAKEVYRVLKPGAHLLAFGGTRTYHRMVCALEDMGFEIRDCLMWLYGSGFPKSLDVSKAIDKCKATHPNLSSEFAKYLKQRRRELGLGSKLVDNLVTGGTTNYSWFEGRPDGQRLPGLDDYAKIKEVLKLDNRFDAIIGEAEREIIGEKDSGCDGGSGASVVFSSAGRNENGLIPITAPATPEAVQWQGWGTALKPAYEPIVLARKPLEGTVAKNVLKYGTGGINVDGCRIGVEEIFTQGGKKGGVAYGDWAEPVNSYHRGRWPSNVLLNEESAKMVDEQSGESRSTIGSPRGTPNQGLFAHSEFNKVGTEHEDSGGASRFFYIAKASRCEREKGLGGPIRNPCSEIWGDGIGGKPHGGPVRNIHPTVKPLELMRYLVRLVTPKDGVCLDPFLGSGTTLLACRLEGFNGLGIEKESTYEPIIRERLSYYPPELESFEKEEVNQDVH